jgi:type I phosphodiesterase/nucleotide pyrophosphatase
MNRVGIVLAGAGLAVLLGAWGCSRARPEARVLLIGLDGGIWDEVRTLKASGKLPNLGRLIDEGSAGPCASLPWWRALAREQGYWSPILWSTIATGKLPSKHGIDDFVMPTAEYARFWMAPLRAAGASFVSLPPLPRGEVRLALKARAPRGIERQNVTVSLQGRTLAELHFGATDEVAWVRIESSGGWSEPTLELRCSELQPLGERSMCLDVVLLRLYDGQGLPLRDYHPRRDLGMERQGWFWHRPQQRIPVASFHRRAKALWQILSERGQRVGVVGWWTSWPAEPVDGVVYSALLGVHGARVTGQGETGWFDRFPGLAHPHAALDRARELFFPVTSVDEEVRRDFYEPGTCGCVPKRHDDTFREFYWEDRYFERLAVDMLERDGPFGLTAVYLRGIDTTSHLFLQMAGNAEAVAGCNGERCDRKRLEQIVENYYRYTDRVVGELLERAGPDTLTVVVTDHGQVPAKNHGDHADNGFLILHGGPVRARVLARTKIADVAPTVLYLLGQPVAQDMDGTVVVDALDPDFLARHPIRYVPTYEKPFDLSEKAEIVDAEAMDQEDERMRALGYVQ